MPDARKNKRSVTEVDRLIGRRLRVARQLKKLSLDQLGTMVGVTYQQVQKYERGISRLPSGRLWSIARALDLPVSFFYPNQCEHAFDDLLFRIDLPSDLDAPRAKKLLRSLTDVSPSVRASLVNVIEAIDGRNG